MRTGATHPAPKMAAGRAQGVWRRRFGDALTELAIWLPLVISAGHVVVFTAWTTWVSFTASSLMPDYTWVGLRNYWAVTRTANFQIAYVNLVIFGCGFVLLTMALGSAAGDPARSARARRKRAAHDLSLSSGGFLRGDRHGVELAAQPRARHPEAGARLSAGRTSASTGWCNRTRPSTRVIFAGVWQGAGFAMALFLAGLRSVDADLVKAAQIDGAGPWRMYRRVLLPTIWPIFVTVFVILLQSAIKTFDLVRALTGGGPGISTMLPTLVVYDFMFQRSELGRGSAAAVLMLLSLVVVLAPYGIYVRWQRQRQARA